MTEFKKTPLVMKGEVKPIESALNNIGTAFQPVFSTVKVHERNVKALRQMRDNNIEASSNKQEKKTIATPDTAITRINAAIDLEKQNTKNTFENFDEKLENEISFKFVEDYGKLVIENKLIYDFFKNLDLISQECIEYVLSEIIHLIDDHYNIINDQHANDFIYYFLLIFDNYILLDSEDPKFMMIHRNLITLFKKSFKNNSDDLVFIYKNIFFKKFFETINNPEFKDKVNPICEIIFKLVEPAEHQLKDIFKLFKDNITNEEILYKVFAQLHDILPSYPEVIIDTCLFYVLTGMNTPIIDIRYYSLYILYKYMLLNVNFYHNFESNNF
jgi:hypothetical protein